MRELTALVTLVTLMHTLQSKPVTIGVTGHLSNGKPPSKGSNLLAFAEAYNQCYRDFTDEFFLVYHAVCMAREKLHVCKQKVESAFPRVEDLVIPGGPFVYEFLANFWCTYKPHVKEWPVDRLFYQYYHCPYTDPTFILLPEDFSVQVRMRWNRAQFADVIRRAVNEPGLNQWLPKHNYSDPSDVVYQALSSVYCAKQQYIQYTARIVSKYCIFGDLFMDLNDKQAQYEHKHLDGVYSWHNSTCSSGPEDPVEKMLDICELEAWLNLQVNSSLDPCHASNVAVRGGACLVMFHTRTSPYTDLHLFMPGFCKPIDELRQCWEGVTRECPREGLASGMDILVKLHQLACDLSLQDSSVVWDITHKWADAVKTVKWFQQLMQSMFSNLYAPWNNPTIKPYAFPLPLAVTLNSTLTALPHLSARVRSVMQDLVSHLSRVNLFHTFHFSGPNILYELYAANPSLAEVLCGALPGPIELFLIRGGFINYDPKNFNQWRIL